MTGAFCVLASCREAPQARPFGHLMTMLVVLLCPDRRIGTPVEERSDLWQVPFAHVRARVCAHKSQADACCNLSPSRRPRLGFAARAAMLWRLFYLRCAMREVPMMRVEVDGKLAHRPGVLDVLQCDSAGKPTLSRMRPQLLPGEVLVERAGTFPAIVGAHPRHAHDMIRHQIVRSVLGTHPAMLAEEADPVALNCLVHRLADASEAARLLCANGYGWPAQSLAETVRALLKLKEEVTS